MKNWWEDHQEIAFLARWMNNRGDRVDNIVYMIEKPWKWDVEYRMIKAVSWDGYNPDDIVEWKQRDNITVDVEMDDWETRTFRLDPPNV